MIDWTAFIDSLDEDNFEDAAEAVRARKVDQAECLAQTLVLSFTEVNIARENPLEAIRVVNHRLRCGILVAKAAVEMVLEADAEEAAIREDNDHEPFPLGEAADDFQETVIGVDQPFSD